MNRVKVLVFALVAVGLWAAHLTMTSAALVARAQEQAAQPLLAAGAAVAQRLETARSDLQSAALKLASNPVVLVKAPAKPEAPTAERFGAVRAAALEALTDPGAKTTSYVIVANELGAQMAQGSADPAPAPEGFDVKGASAAGGDGVLLELSGSPYLFFSVPLLGAVGGEVKAGGTVIIGGPVWGSYASVDQLADAVAKDLQLGGVGLYLKGRLAGAGGKRELVEKAFKLPKTGKVGVIEQGPAATLGPLKLPLFAGVSALEVGAHTELAGTPFELAVVGSVRPSLEPIAAQQKLAIMLLLGLLAAGIVFTLLVSSGGGVEEEDDVPMPSRPQTGPSPAHKPADKVEPLAGSLPEAAPAPVAAGPVADDFDFPPPPPARPEPQVTTLDPVPAASPFDGPAEDPFAAAGFPPPPVAAPPMPMASARPAPSTLSLGDDDFGNQRTMAYPAHQAQKMVAATAVTDSHQVLDPFSMAGPPSPVSRASDDLDGEGDYNPDATKVASIPPELLKSARRDANTTTQTPAYKAPTVAAPKIASVAPVATPGASDEETHFQETFRDFLATRQKCGEPNDGMTYDKFAAKLRKNKEQLVAKYSCRTVRFQVYVKEGKAALKATPVKE